MLLVTRRLQFYGHPGQQLFIPEIAHNGHQKQWSVVLGRTERTINSEWVDTDCPNLEGNVLNKPLDHIWPEVNSEEVDDGGRED